MFPRDCERASGGVRFHLLAARALGPACNRDQAVKRPRFGLDHFSGLLFAVHFLTCRLFRSGLGNAAGFSLLWIAALTRSAGESCALDCASAVAKLRRCCVCGNSPVREFSLLIRGTPHFIPGNAASSVAATYNHSTPAMNSAPVTTAMYWSDVSMAAFLAIHAMRASSGFNLTRDLDGN